MKKVMITILILLTWISLFSTGFSRSDGKKKISLRKPDIVDLIFVNYNNWSYVMRNNGSYMYDSPDQDDNGNNAGGEFPRGSAVTVVYAGGFMLGAIKNGSPVVSAAQWSTEFQPGRIINSGVSYNDLESEDPLSPLQQVYLIDRTRTGDDYTNWPSDASRNSKGDPALIADAQTWAVFNDQDTSLIENWNGQDRILGGLGVQITLESFASNFGILANSVFFKFTVANKTNTDHNSAYIAIWMDPDVDGSSNDYGGCDTVSHRAFIYNSISSWPDAPRAVAIQWLQGPVVKSSEIPLKEALKFQNNKTVMVYDPHVNRYKPQTLDADHITLDPTAFLVHDEESGNRDMYYHMAGLDYYGQPRWGTGANDYYNYRGDPLGPNAGTDPNVPHGSPWDIKVTYAAGPFIFKANSTQELWVAIAGGISTDRLGALRDALRNADMARTGFSGGFPSPEPLWPNLSVSSLDRKIVLTWQNNAELSEDLTGELTGISTANGYSADYIKNDFQGYRVYRSLTGLEGSFELLAQYDKVDEFGYVTDRRINIRGTLEMNEIHVGDNTGLRYSYTDTDVINGQNYFYSVTAFDAQPYIGGPDSVFFDGYLIPKPLGLPISMESPIIANTISAVPQNNLPSIGSEARIDSAGVTQISGMSDGAVELDVVDPAAVTGGQYTVQFYNLPDSINGKAIINNSETRTGQLVYRIMKNGLPTLFSSKIDDPRTWIDGGNGVLDVDGNGSLINGDEIFDDRLFSTSIAIPGTSTMEQFDICEGILVKVYGPALQGVWAGYSIGPQYTVAGISQGVRWFSGVNFGRELIGGGVGLSYGFFGSTISPADLKTVEIRFSRTIRQMAYGHTGATGIQNEFFPVPFTVWDVDQEDALPDRQLNVLCRDGSLINGNGWFLDNVLGGDGSGPQQRTYMHIVLSNYDSTAGSLSGLSVDSLPSIWSLALSPRRIYYYGFADGFTWNDLLKAARTSGSDGGTTVTAAERDSIYALIPDEGILKLTAPNMITENDQFAYSTSARTVASKSDIKRAMKDIKVVPNPFYKYSSFETSLDKLIKFTNLPDVCTIKIFTVAGDLIKTIKHNATSNNDRVNSNPYEEDFEPGASSTSIEKWDLKTANGRYIASGMYIALIESSAGKRLVKFAVIQ